MECQSAGKGVPAMGAKKAGKRKRAKVRRDEEVYFVVQITDWDWSFSFGAGWRRDIDREPYSDYRHLHVKGSYCGQRRSRRKRQSWSSCLRLH